MAARQVLKADDKKDKKPPPGYESWEEFNNAHPRGPGGKFGSGGSASTKDDPEWFDQEAYLRSDRAPGRGNDRPSQQLIQASERTLAKLREMADAGSIDPSVVEEYRTIHNKPFSSLNAGEWKILTDTIRANDPDPKWKPSAKPTGNANSAQARSGEFTIAGHVFGQSKNPGYINLTIGGVEKSWLTEADSKGNLGRVYGRIDPDEYSSIAKALKQKYPSLKETTEQKVHNLSGRKFSTRVLSGFDKYGNRIYLAQHYDRIDKGQFIMDGHQYIQDQKKPSRRDTF